MYDVYSEVSQFMAWLQETVLRNGGLASCGGLTLQAHPEAPAIAEPGAGTSVLY